MKKIIVLCVAVIQIMILLGLIIICITFFWSAENKEPFPQPKVVQDPSTKMLRFSYDDIDWGMTQDEALASYKKWLDKAEKGDMIAQNNVGDHYIMGMGVEKDEAEGVKWYRLSAEQGYSHAQHNLAACFAFGRGTHRNEKEAVKWWKLSAEQGFAPAQISLGACYGMGAGVPQDDEMSFKWYRKAAEQGDPFAEYQVASCYDVGYGVLLDKNRSEFWAKRSAEHGNPMGQYLYSRYCSGRMDYDEMNHWLHKAAEQDYAPAQYNLGIRYFRGEHVPKDLDKSTKYMKKAAQNGDEEAKEWLANMKDVQE